MFDSDYPVFDASTAADVPAIHRLWLSHLCQAIPHALCARLTLRIDNSTQSFVYPDDLALAQAFEDRTLPTEKSPIEIYSFQQNNADYSSVICRFPRAHASQISVSQGQPLEAAVTVIFPRLNETQLEALSRLIQQNFCWHSMLLTYPSNQQWQAERHGGPFSFDEILRSSTPNACAATVCDEIAQCFGCERVLLVSINRHKNNELLAISGIKQPDARQNCNVKALNLIKELQAADATQVIANGDGGPSQAPTADNRARDEEVTLAKIFETSSGQEFGLVVELPHHEGDRARLFDDHEAANTIPAALEVLAMKISAAAGIYSTVRHLIGQSLRQYLGVNKTRSKAFALVALIILAAAFLIPMDFRISAPAQLEGATQRAIVAPFDGYISAAHVEAGMSVARGQLLAELDLSELSLEQQKWQAEKSKLTREYDRALAELNQAEAQIIRSQIGQADAELNLVIRQIEQTKLYAPFDGVVITGDLSRSIGAPLEQGETLFEIAPLDNYRLVLSVDERDIAQLKNAQSGALVLNALPKQSWPFTVTTIANAVPSKTGERFFRVEASVDEASTHLRPGMEGLGKVLIGRESAAYIASRRFLNWVRLNLWAYLP